MAQFFRVHLLYEKLERNSHEDTIESLLPHKG